MHKLNLAQKLELFSETWTPKIIAEFNGQQLKLAKLKGEFVWHTHAAEDELFLVLEGSLTIKLPTGEVHLEKGEVFIVPRGVEHNPVTSEGASVLLIEPKATKHTGQHVVEQTVENPDWI